MAMTMTTAMTAVVLRGAGGEYRLTAGGWTGLLRLAVEFGWRPLGLALPDDCEVDCELVPGLVGGADARSLADALEAALPRIPDLCGLVYYPGCAMLVDDRPAGGLDLSRPGVLPWFSKGGLVPDVIAFARAGGFAVDDPGRH
jgi:hypothetical protein